MENSLIDKKIDFDEALKSIFKPVGTDEADLLRIASEFSLQLTGDQIKGLLMIDILAFYCEKAGLVDRVNQLRSFIKNYLEFKSKNNSYKFILSAMREISLSRFINENTTKVNVEK